METGLILPLFALSLLLLQLLILGLLYRQSRSVLSVVQRLVRATRTAERNAQRRWLEDQSRSYLADLLQTEAAALPPSGPWVAPADFLGLVAQHILTQKPHTVVEFGAGASTLTILRCLRLNGQGALVSFDHDPLYAKITRERAILAGLQPDIRVVQLQDAAPYPGRWYAAADLPPAIDCLIVDGPPANLHAETRAGAASLFDRLTPGGHVFLDDAGRPGEQAIVELWQREHPEIRFSVLRTANGIAVGEKAVESASSS